MDSSSQKKPTVNSTIGLSRNLLTLIAIILLGGWLVLDSGTTNKPNEQQSAVVSRPIPPVVHGLYVGMPMEAAQEIVNRTLKQFLFTSDEFMYRPFAKGSNAYKDAETLRKHLRFVKQNDGTSILGGTFSFGYNSSNMRSTYPSVYNIIPREIKLYSKKQSFGCGITLTADSNGIISTIAFKPNFIKNILGQNSVDSEEYIKQFVKQHKLDSLDKHINGPFTGDMSMTYTYDGDGAFSVTIDEDLEIVMRLIKAE
ncbi:MAG: hypothetical protein HQL70_05540 [Magnetococcales bacterium]|nr:hypothetical protein [Magnetococcales bacterium]